DRPGVGRAGRRAAGGPPVRPCRRGRPDDGQLGRRRAALSRARRRFPGPARSRPGLRGTSGIRDRLTGSAPGPGRGVPRGPRVRLRLPEPVRSRRAAAGLATGPASPEGSRSRAMKVMFPNPFRRKRVAAGALAWVVLTCLAWGNDRGQTAPGPAAGGDRLGPQPYYTASRQGCGRAGCHASPPRKDEEFVCRCDEYARWAEHDKHADATRVLSGPYGRKMARELGYDVTRAEACLRCHSVVTHAAAR